MFGRIPLFIRLLLDFIAYFYWTSVLNRSDVSELLLILMSILSFCAVGSLSGWNCLTHYYIAVSVIVSDIISCGRSFLSVNTTPYNLVYPSE